MAKAFGEIKHASGLDWLLRNQASRTLPVVKRLDYCCDACADTSLKDFAFVVTKVLGTTA